MLQPAALHSKLNNHSLPTIYLSPAHNSAHHHQLWIHKTNSIVESHNVIFSEDRGACASAKETTSDAKETTSNAKETASDTEETTSNTKETTSDTKEATSNAKETASNTKEAASDAKESTSNAKETTSNTKEAASNTGEPASNAKEPVQQLPSQVSLHCLHKFGGVLDKFRQLMTDNSTMPDLMDSSNNEDSNNEDDYNDESDNDNTIIGLSDQLLDMGTCSEYNITNDGEWLPTDSEEQATLNCCKPIVR